MGFIRNLTSILASGLIALSGFAEEKTIHRELYERVEKMGGKFEHKNGVLFDVWAKNNDLVISVIVRNIGIIYYDKGCEGLDEYRMFNLDNFYEISNNARLEKASYVHRTRQLLAIIEGKTGKDIFK